jgi:YesN/AraC family two-component response regulator
VHPPSPVDAFKEIAREGLVMVLATQPDMNLVAQSSNGREAIQMPEMDGLDAMIAIRKEFRTELLGNIRTVYSGN